MTDTYFLGQFVVINCARCCLSYLRMRMAVNIINVIRNVAAMAHICAVSLAEIFILE